jgi:hypothetical protein
MKKMCGKSEVNSAFELMCLFVVICLCLCHKFVACKSNTSSICSLNIIPLFSEFYHCFCDSWLSCSPSICCHISIHDPSIYACTMPSWTKQTCKKSTGGVAPRVTLNLPGAISRLEVGTTVIEEEERLDHNLHAFFL